ncbi:MAG: LysM peptidoglycan-binding domain-containing protein [Anaerolineales bacterium]
MNSSLRQLGSGLLYALISVVLVVGGLSLAMAEGVLKGSPAGLPGVTATAPSTGVTELLTASPVPSVAPSATVQVLIATPTTIIVEPSATTFVQPVASLRPVPSATRGFYPSAIPCGPYYGWTRSYIVQPGDTLFHIATLYQTTLTAVQIANCKFASTTIYPGERLWVPNVPTVTPGLTFFPTFTFPTSTPLPFVTPTEVPTEPLTLTPVPTFFTETAIPTQTSVPSP